MRYIKLYENFRDKDRLKRNIEDCLVELKDDGFNIETIIYDSYINIEIKNITTHNFIVEFELSDIKEYIIQLVDYMKEKYSNLNIKYVPETRWENGTYDNLDDIPSEYLDLISFNIYFNWVYADADGVVTSLIYENYEQEEDSDWGKDGFGSNEKELKKRVENIFVELVDEGYLVDVDISFMSIAVSIQLNNKNFQTFEENKFIDNEFVRDYVEMFIEYIRERNKNIHSEIGLRVRYELNQGQNAMHRKYIYDEFPGPENSQIVELKIVLGV